MIVAQFLISASLCTAYGAAELRGEVATEQLNEASGLAFSADGDRLWSHNDSGDIARLFAFDRDGRDWGQVELIDRQAFDWEDLAAGPCDGSRCLYIGDIGDNLKQRDHIEILRLNEPIAPGEGQLLRLQAQAIELSYPDGPRDAESLAVDGQSGDLLIVTKLRERPASEVFLLAAEAWTNPQAHSLRLIGEINWTGEGYATQATAASMAPDGQRLFVQTYTQALWIDLERQDGRIIGLGASQPATNWSLGQCEAVAIAPDGGSLWFTCEGSPAPLASANCIVRAPPSAQPPAQTNGCGGCQTSPGIGLWSLFLLALRWRERAKRVQGTRSLK